MKWKLPLDDHGILDYLMAFFLMAVPYYSTSIPLLVRWVTITTGMALLWYSLFTDYPNSGWPKIPAKIHMVLDATAGATILIAVYVSRVHYPHSLLYLLGAVLLALPLVTEKKKGR